MVSITILLVFLFTCCWWLNSFVTLGCCASTACTPGCHYFMSHTLGCGSFSYLVCGASLLCVTACNLVALCAASMKIATSQFNWLLACSLMLLGTFFCTIFVNHLAAATILYLQCWHSLCLLPIFGSIDSAIWMILCRHHPLHVCSMIFLLLAYCALGLHTLLVPVAFCFCHVDQACAHMLMLLVLGLWVWTNWVSF